MEAKKLDSVEQFVADNRKAFEEGVDSEALKDFYEYGSFKGYKLLGVQKKLNKFCNVERKRVDGHFTRIYRLKSDEDIINDLAELLL